MSIATTYRGRFPASAISRTQSLSFIDVVAFLFGAGSQLVVRIVGDMPVAELLVLVLGVPVAVLYRRRAMRRDFIWIYILLGFWLMNQIVTDIYRETALLDWVRGDAAIVFFALDIVFACMILSCSDRRKLIYVAGLVIGSLVATRIQPDEAMIDYPWKFGYAMSVNLAVVYLSAYLYNHRKNALALLMIACVSVVNLYFNFRSPLLIFLVTLALTTPIIPERIGQWRILPREGSRSRVAVMILLAVLTSIGAGALVKAVSVSSLLSDDAREKNMSQAKVKGGLLIGGRPEILVSSIAVADSPILGHGSWAKDYKYIELLNDMLYERGMGEQEDLDTLEQESEGTIPVHSHLMTAWVWAGIMGAAFWFYILWLLLKFVARLAAQRTAFAPLYAYMAVGMIWDIGFSPFGEGRRIMEAAVILIAADALSAAPSRVAYAAAQTRQAWRRGAMQIRIPARQTFPVTRGQSPR